jgi:hypothetical protein
LCRKNHSVPGIDRFGLIGSSDVIRQYPRKVPHFLLLLHLIILPLYLRKYNPLNFLVSYFLSERMEAKLTGHLGYEKHDLGEKTITNRGRRRARRI